MTAQPWAEQQAAELVAGWVEFDTLGEVPDDSLGWLRERITTALQAARAKGRAEGLESARAAIWENGHDHMDPDVVYGNCSGCKAIRQLGGS